MHGLRSRQICRMAMRSDPDAIFLGRIRTSSSDDVVNDQRKGDVQTQSNLWAIPNTTPTPISRHFKAGRFGVENFALDMTSQFSRVC